MADSESKEWFDREIEFAVDAHDLTDSLITDLRQIVPEPLGSNPAITEEQYAQAAQLIACRRNTCGHPDGDPSHSTERTRV